MDFRMDLDPVDNNAEAGPSTGRSHSQQPEASTSSMTIPPVFLPPPPHSIRSPPFSAAHDLIGRFQLQVAYDKYVKPNVLPVDQWQTSDGGNLDKGKGREKDAEDADLNMDAGSPNDPSGNESKKRKKESSYKHLIKAVVGKHSMKKDTYLVDAISVPPKQKMEIKKFDERTQNDAFWVSPEGLKGYNIHALIPETEQAREDRKRRKEAKKAEKARLAALSAGATIPSTMPEALQSVMQAPTPMTNGAPTPAANGFFPSTSVVMGVQNDRMTNHPPQNTQSRQGGKGAETSTPTSQQPGTPINRQGAKQPPQRSNLPSQQSQTQVPPLRPNPTPNQSRAPVHTQSQPQSQTHIPEITPRGVKRDRPDTPLSQHHPSHTHSSPQVFSNHHGMAGHPNTAKKRRLESATAVR